MRQETDNSRLGEYAGEGKKGTRREGGRRRQGTVIDSAGGLTLARSRLYLQTLQPQKDGRIGIRLETLMRDAGFVNVESRMMQLPLCGWPDSTLLCFVLDEERLTWC